MEEEEGFGPQLINRLEVGRFAIVIAVQDKQCGLKLVMGLSVVMIKPKV